MTDNFSSNGYTRPATASAELVDLADKTVVQATSKIAALNPLARLQLLESELNSILIERNDAIRAALIALIARQNVVLLGPPGCGKSLIVTELARRIQDNNLASTGNGLTCFTLLMTKYTDPDEVFGPISLTALKNDERKRTTTHKLPEAHFAFLDEAFKAGSAVLNTLLTLMNEREFDNGGANRLRVPLISLFGASNELPEGRELEAFWDRFLLRVVVNPVSEAGFERLINLLMNPPAAASAFLGLSELLALQAQVRQVGFSTSVKGAYLKLRKNLAAKGITASDRRWGQCLALLQANALIEGRQTVEEDDLSTLEYALWNTPEQRGDIKKLIGQLANPVAAKALEFFDQATNIHQTALSAYKKASNEDERGLIVVDAVGKLKATLNNLITACAPDQRVTLEAGGRDGVKNVIANLTKASQTRSLNKIENIIVQVSRMRDELVEHVS